MAYIVISKENAEHEKAIKNCDELIENFRIVTKDQFVHTSFLTWSCYWLYLFSVLTSQ